MRGPAGTERGGVSMAGGRKGQGARKGNGVRGHRLPLTPSGKKKEKKEKKREGDGFRGVEEHGY